MALDKAILYAEYEKILVGNKKNFSSSIFPSDNPRLAKENAIEIMRYAFEKFLHWEPRDIERGLTMDLVRFLKLHTVVTRLDIAEDFNPTIHSKYLAHMLYPNSIPFSEGDMAVDIYKKVRDGKYKAFPKKFFQNEEGLKRARAVMNYVICNETGMHISSIQDVYEWCLTKEGIARIRSLGLSQLLNLYECPIDLVHDSIAPEQQDEFLWQYCRFRYLYKKAKMGKEAGFAKIPAKEWER